MHTYIPHSMPIHNRASLFGAFSDTRSRTFTKLEHIAWLVTHTHIHTQLHRTQSHPTHSPIQPIFSLCVSIHFARALVSEIRHAHSTPNPLPNIMATGEWRGGRSYERLQWYLANLFVILLVLHFIFLHAFIRKTTTTTLLTSPLSSSSSPSSSLSTVGVVVVVVFVGVIVFIFARALIE